MKRKKYSQKIESSKKGEGTSCGKRRTWGEKQNSGLRTLKGEKLFLKRKRGQPGRKIHTNNDHPEVERRKKEHQQKERRGEEKSLNKARLEGVKRRNGSDYLTKGKNLLYRKKKNYGETVPSTQPRRYGRRKASFPYKKKKRGEPP